MRDVAEILVVDDYYADRLLLELALKPLGAVVLMAESGKEALEKLASHDVAVALLDVKLPGMSGIELAERMRSNVATSEIPIIFITGMREDRDHMFKGYELGAVDYLFKPVNHVVLQAKVQVFIDLFLKCRKVESKLQRKIRELNDQVLSLERAVQALECGEASSQ